MDKLLEKQIAKIRKKYPESEFLERIFEKISDTYKDFDRIQHLRERAIQLMSSELLELNEQTRQKNEAFISTILGNVVDGIITCDRQGRIIYMNTSAEQIIGGTQNSLTGKCISTVLEEFNSYDELVSWYERNSSLMEKQVEVLFVGQEQTQIPCELSVSKVEFDEVAAIVIFRDITERKRTENTILLEKEKAEKASHAKAEFLSTMSHEIRTPMNSIIGMTNLLLQDEVNEEVRDILNTLKFSSDHLMVLINDILDFNKIDIGKVEFEEINFDLKKLISNILDSNRYRADEKGLSIHFEWDDHIHPYVVGDSGRLAQILTNLVANAIKFTETGEVSVYAKQLATNDENQHIYFEVKDTGIGIAENKLDHIFESFSQSETYTRRKYGGTGLGLAITKRLIQLQGGKIGVRSTLHEGSTFFFELSLNKADSTKIVIDDIPSLEKSELKNLSGLRILLVEDNPMNQVVADKFLSKWGCELEIIDDGVYAIETLESSQTFDLILMDLQMPQQNGFETTQQIRSSDNTFKDIPILALTAAAVLEEKDRAISAGMNDFITKPFMPDELYEKIMKNLNSHS